MWLCGDFFVKVIQLVFGSDLYLDLRFGCSDLYGYYLERIFIQFYVEHYSSIDSSISCL